MMSEFKGFSEVKQIDEYVSVGVMREDSIVGYVVIEPPLTKDEESILERAKEVIMYMEDSIPIEILRNGAGKVDYIMDIAGKILAKKFKLGRDSAGKLLYYIIRDLAGYGKIDPLMRDRDIEDISCSGADLPVYVFHKKYGYLPTNIMLTEDELLKLVYKLSALARRQISTSQPIIEGILPDGSRVSCNLPVVSTKGASFTIRKYTFKPLSILDMVKYGTLNIDIAVYLWMLADAKKSIIICGEVGAGKTTLMNAVLGLIPRDRKIITVEETPEIRLEGFKNWTQKVTRESYRMGVANIDLFELVKSALRERPDYIIVGEVRGKEAYTLFQAIALGHGGIATVHAGSIEKAITRLTSEPLNIPKPLIGLVSCMIHMVKIPTKSGILRRVGRVSEVLYKDDGIELNDIFRYNHDRDEFEKVGKSRIINDGDEYERRKAILRYLYKSGKTSWSEIVHAVARYSLEPDEMYMIALSEGGE